MDDPKCGKPCPPHSKTKHVAELILPPESTTAPGYNITTKDFDYGSLANPVEEGAQLSGRWNIWLRGTGVGFVIIPTLG